MLCHTMEEKNKAHQFFEIGLGLVHTEHYHDAIDMLSIAISLDAGFAEATNTGASLIIHAAPIRKHWMITLQPFRWTPCWTTYTISVGWLIYNSCTMRMQYTTSLKPLN